MKKYKLKKIYKLSETIKNRRAMKKALKEKYNIEITTKELNSILDKIPVFKYNNRFSLIMEKKILYMYKNYDNSDILVKYLNDKYDLDLTYGYLRDLASKRGVKKINYKSKKMISKSDELEIVKLYKEGLSSIKLAKMFGYKGKKSILEILEKHKVERRKSSYNQEENKTYKNFSLNVIDSKEKAYFIGLMITDGYVNAERNYIGLDLTDFDVMLFISKFINVKLVPIKPKNKKHKVKYRITLYGKELVRESERFGVVPRKTFITKGCNLNPDEEVYLPYILRGMIDGDGWVREDGKEFYISSASEQLIIWIKEFMINKLGFVDIDYTFIPNEYKGIYWIRTAIQENIAILKEKIYDIPFGMNRKYDRLYKERDVQRV